MIIPVDSEQFRIAIGCIFIYRTNEPIACCHRRLLAQFSITCSENKEKKKQV